MKSFIVRQVYECFVGEVIRIVPTGKDYAIRENRWGQVELIDNKGKSRTVKGDRIVYVQVGNVGDYES